MDANKLTYAQKKASLRYLMFLKQKRCGKIKVRGCADGRKQRETTNKQDTTSPTLAIKSVMLMETIDTMEECDRLVTVDMPGAFI